MQNKFKITKDTQGTNNIPIPPPRELEKSTAQFPYGFEFPVAKLVSVKFDPAKEYKKDDVTVSNPVLILVFADDKKRVFTTIEFPKTNDDAAKEEQQLDWFANRIKHLWDETIGADKFPEELGGSDYAEYFKNIADAFNGVTITRGEGEKAKQIPVYSTVQLYIKLTYYKANMQLPTFPNFVQKATIGNNPVPCELRINPSHDNVKPQKSARGGASLPALGHDASFGDFGGFATDFPDIPNS